MPMMPEQAFYLSIHVNESEGASGFEVWVPNDSTYESENREISDDLAEKILEALAEFGLPNRGLKTSDYVWTGSDNVTHYDYYPDGHLADYLGVLRYSRRAGMVGLLVEHGFIDGLSADVAILSNDNDLVRMGYDDADAIASEFVSAPAFGSASASVSGATASLSLPVTSSASSVTNAAFAVSAGGTTRWYQASRTSDSSSWTAAVPLSDFRAYGAYSVAAWASVNGGSAAAVGKASFAVAPAHGDGNRGGRLRPRHSGVHLGDLGHRHRPRLLRGHRAQRQVVLERGADLGCDVLRDDRRVQSRWRARALTRVDAWLEDGMGAISRLGSTTCALSGVSAPAFGSASASVSGATASLSLPVTSSASSVTNAAFAVSAGGTTRWYQASRTSDSSSWTAAVPLSDFRAYGAYSVAAWASVNGGSAAAVGKASFAVAQPTGTVTAAAASGLAIAASTSVTSATGIDHVSYAVTAPNGKSCWSEAQTSGATCSATIDVSSLGGGAGTYAVDAWLEDGMGAISRLGSTTCALSGVSAPAFGSASASVSGATASLSLPVTSSASSVTNAAFAVSAGGTTRWYQASRTSDSSSWTAAVPLSDFRAYGAYSVAAWASVNGGSAAAVGKASFAVAQPTGTVTAAAASGLAIAASTSVTSATGIDHVSYAVTAPNGKSCWSEAQTSGATCSATIDVVQSLGGGAGTYAVDAWLEDGMGAISRLGSTTCALSGVSAPAFGSASASVSGATASLSLPVTSSASSVTNAAFAVSAGGTTRWYQASRTSDSSSWTAAVPLSDFRAYGAYSVAAWASGMVVRPPPSVRRRSPSPSPRGR